MNEHHKPVLIVGGGIAGLSCARMLRDSNVAFLVIERADHIGGRIRTDQVDGFLLDRGFQALQTAYPEAQRQLNYERLDLRPFLPGSIIRRSGRFRRMIDPWRRPVDGVWSALTNSVGTIADKYRIAKLRLAANLGEIQDLFSAPEQTTHTALKGYGFSDEIIDGFFRPFLGGIFLERELVTSSRMLHFVFRMMSQGDVSLPSMGMQAIPDQLAEGLPGESILLNAEVREVSETGVVLNDGRSFEGSHIVLATAGNVTAKLLGEPEPEFQSVRCLYYSCDQPPVKEPVLILNGEEGPINNLTVPTLLSSEYAPDDKHLVSISVVDSRLTGDELENAVLKQATEWFGEEVQNWQHLKTYDIRHALPSQASGRDLPTGHAKRVGRMIVCGDSLGHASIQSALVSGRHAAEMILEST